MTAKSFDRKGLVLLCSSVSKILSPGYRVGWVLAGRFRAEVERLKLVTSMAAPSLPQWVVAEFLESGSYDRHVRKLRATLACQMESVRQAIARYFPAGRASAGLRAATCYGLNCPRMSMLLNCIGPHC